VCHSWPSGYRPSGYRQQISMRTRNEDYFERILGNELRAWLTIKRFRDLGLLTLLALQLALLLALLLHTRKRFRDRS
jgi:hypothetical protein